MQGSCPLLEIVPYRARLFNCSHNSPEALRCYQRFIELDPENDEMRLLMA
jgi:hypothetical protein